MTPKAVSVGELMHLSASQLTTWALCHRKWWFEKVACIPVPQELDGPLGLGLAVHGQMEGWYKDGVIPEHPSAALLVESGNLPPRGQTSLRVEYPGNFKLGISVAGVPIHGKIDLLDLTDAPARVDVWDWKTRKDLKYALSSDGLERDVQMMLYGKYAVERHGAEWVSFHHANLRTDEDKQPAYKIVTSTELSAVDVDCFVSSVVEPLVYEVKLDAGADDFHDVTPNYNACHKYNRPCPFIDKCAENTSVHLSMLFKEDGMGLDLKMRETTTSTAAGLHLYINAVPVKGLAFTYLDDIIGAASSDICGAKKVLDLRLLPYGEGKGLLAAGLRANPPSGVVVATSGELSDVAIEALLPLASVVVRGTR